MPTAAKSLAMSHSNACTSVRNVRSLMEKVLQDNAREAANNAVQSAQHANQPAPPAGPAPLATDARALVRRVLRVKADVMEAEREMRCLPMSAPPMHLAQTPTTQMSTRMPSQAPPAATAATAAAVTADQTLNELLRRTEYLKAQAEREQEQGLRREALLRKRMLELECTVATLTDLVTTMNADLACSNACSKRRKTGLH